MMINLKSKINSFFVFNSSLGPKEGDELKRILYFHPSHIATDGRKMQVGLCEAVVKFMSNFSDEPCQALQTQSKRYVFYQPEKDYWMVMIVRIPYATKPVSAIGDSQNEEIIPKAVKDSLVSAYTMFKLFMGPFSEIPLDQIYTKCENFFDPYISQRSFGNDLSNVMQGINYLPLDKAMFFKVMSLIDLLEVSYPAFRCVSFVYYDQVVWNDLSKSDNLTVYKYIVQTLLPEHIEKELQGGAVASAQKHGRFISPPEGIRTADDLDRISQVNLTADDGTMKKYRFFVYRTLNATVSFTVDVDTKLELDELRSFDAFIGPQLSSLASLIGDRCAAQALQASQLSDSKYIYFNRVDLSYRSSVNATKLTPSTMIRPEVLKIIAAMHEDKKTLSNYGEIILKTTDDYWITGKKSNEREFYVVIQQKNANLKEISDEVKRICDAELKGIFFYPI